MKYVVGIILLLAIVGGGAVLWRMQLLAAAASANTAPETRAVQRRTIHRGITATGTVASNIDVDIKCQASGRVIRLPVDISMHVKPGDLLMELDPTDQQRSLDQAKAQVSSSQARLLQAKMSYDIAVKNLVTTTNRTEADLQSAQAKADDARSKADRTDKLFKATPISLASKEDVETAETAVAQADAALINAKAAIAELDQQKISVESKLQDITLAESQLTQDKVKQELQQQQLDYCKVYVPTPSGAPATGPAAATAPASATDSASAGDSAAATGPAPASDPAFAVDYRVASIGAGVQVGAIVQSGSSGFSGGTTVMTLSDLSHIYILATVDESDIGMVRLGQIVRITADAYQGLHFEGKVVRIATKGISTNNVVTFEVKIEVTDANRLLLKPAMTANVEIVLEEAEDVLVIPLAAVSKTKPEAIPDPSAKSMPSSMGSPSSAASRPSGGGSGRRGGGGGRGGRGRNPGGPGGAGADQPLDANTLVISSPTPAWVRVFKSDNSIDTREIVTGITDGNDCEVLSGLEEGDLVIINKASSDSRWRGTNPLQQFRGLTGGGGGGGGGRGGR